MTPLRRLWVAPVLLLTRHPSISALGRPSQRHKSPSHHRRLHQSFVTLAAARSPTTDTDSACTLSSPRRDPPRSLQEILLALKMASQFSYPRSQVLVLGAGHFGCCLADHLGTGHVLFLHFSIDLLIGLHV